MNKIRCTVVTYNHNLLDQDVDMVVLPGLEGEIGVLFNHAPMVIEMRAGQLKIYIDSGVRLYHITGGFAHIAHNNCSIIADIEQDSYNKTA